jgi:hypothetical protein
MTYPEIPETEVSKIHQQFPNRSTEEIMAAIETAKAIFHGSRGSTRGEILSRLLGNAVS